MKPLISIIIVNWNGRKWLERCLDSILAQTYHNWEIILVDNNSTDDSVNFLQAKYLPQYSNIKLVHNCENVGFAQGNNLGFEKSLGTYICLLNTDTWIESTYLENMIKAFDGVPTVACVQSKIVLMAEPTKLDCCGSYLTDSTFLYHYGFMQPAHLSIYNKVMPFYSLKGASLMIRRDVIKQIGLFDKDYWCYYEETDFCHRVWLTGFECWYHPKAVCYHALGGSAKAQDTEIIEFNNFKNKMITIIKNYNTLNMILYTFIFLVGSLCIELIWLIQGRYSRAKAINQAIIWNIKNIKTTMKKRQDIQKLRRKSDTEIFNIVKKNPPLRYYWYTFFGLEKL